jgi:nucleoside-diphosphate-sugar epimerase
VAAAFWVRPLRLPYPTVSLAPYTDSKIAADKLVLAANGRNGLATCAVRPHVVFGPGDNRFLPAVLSADRLTGKVKAGLFGSFPFTAKKEAP